MERGESHTYLRISYEIRPSPGRTSQSRVVATRRCCCCNTATRDPAATIPCQAAATSSGSPGGRLISSHRRRQICLARQGTRGETVVGTRLNSAPASHARSSTAVHWRLMPPVTTQFNFALHRGQCPSLTPEALAQGCMGWSRCWSCDDEVPPARGDRGGVTVHGGSRNKTSLSRLASSPRSEEEDCRIARFFVLSLFSPCLACFGSLICHVFPVGSSLSLISHEAMKVSQLVAALAAICSSTAVDARLVARVPQATRSVVLPADGMSP